MTRRAPASREQDEIRVKALQQALIAGEQSGVPEPFDFEAFKAAKRKAFSQASD